MQMAIVNPLAQLRPYSLGAQVTFPLNRTPPHFVVKASKKTDLHNETNQTIILKQIFGERKIAASVPEKKAAQVSLRHLSKHGKEVEIYLGPGEEHKTKKSLTYTDFERYEKMFFSCGQKNTLIVEGHPRPHNGWWKKPLDLWRGSGTKVSPEEEMELIDKVEVMTTEIIET